MSQADNVLEFLRVRGARGVHTHEIRGLFVANPSERVRELRQRGHVIDTSAKEPLHGKALGVRYTLARDAERPAGTPPVEMQDDGQLRIGEAA